METKMNNSGIAVMHEMTTWMRIHPFASMLVFMLIRVFLDVFSLEIQPVPLLGLDGRRKGACIFLFVRRCVL